jgi:uncharacterized protein YfaQ (DUF2300 family)
MTPSPAAPAEFGAVGVLVGRLRTLTAEEVTAIARASEHGRATAAGDLEWWRVTMAVSRDLRRCRRSRRAAVASLLASEAVLAAPGAARVPRCDVVQTARTAGEVARALVAGRTAALCAAAGPGWGAVIDAAASSLGPTAA